MSSKIYGLLAFAVTLIILSTCSAIVDARSAGIYVVPCGQARVSGDALAPVQVIGTPPIHAPHCASV